MAIKYYCDGCDRETDGNLYIVAIMTVSEALDALKGIHSEKQKITGSPEYHLCERCLSRLRDDANPTKWPRSEKAA